ncbi:hypothetical protein ACWF62_16530 [Rhodococcus sp. NPDC054953]
MTDDHAAVMAELRALATAAMDRFEPLLERALEVAAAVAEPDPDAPADPGSGCGWCPVCALVALLRGESHELLTLVAAQVAALLTLVRTLLDEHRPEPSEEGPAADPTPNRRAFVPIRVQTRDNPEA